VKENRECVGLSCKRAPHLSWRQDDVRSEDDQEDSQQDDIKSLLGGGCEMRATSTLAVLVQQPFNCLTRNKQPSHRQ